MGGSVGPHWVNWSEPNEALTVGLELIQETTEMLRKIQEHIKAAQSRQKSYADKRRRPLEYQVGDMKDIVGDKVSSKGIPS